MITKNELIKLAEELESSDNETLVAAENDEVLLDKVAFTLAKAASALREVAECVSALEPSAAPFTEEKLEEIAAVAEAFAESDDELLQKQASVLDDLLITLGSPQNAYLFSLADKDDRIEQLKKKYKDTLEEQHKSNKISEAVKAIEDSPVYKEYRTNEQPLSTRYCPIHAGVSLQRVGEGVFSCSLDGKTFDFADGFDAVNGKVPGGSVSNQTKFDGNASTFSTLDSRAQRMGNIQGE